MAPDSQAAGCIDPEGWPRFSILDNGQALQQETLRQPIADQPAQSINL